MRNQISSGENENAAQNRRLLPKIMVQNGNISNFIWQDVQFHGTTCAQFTFFALMSPDVPFSDHTNLAPQL